MPRRAASLVLVLVVLGCGVAPAASPSFGPSAEASASALPSASAPNPAIPTPTAVVSPTPHASAAPTPTRQPTTQPATTPKPVVTPRPTATPRATARPTSPPPVSQVVRHGSRSSGAVALTFDMGGRVGDARAIVDWLVARRIHATIFMTGAMADNVNTAAGRDVLALIDAHPELFTLGNHSYTHTDFRTLSAAQMATELRRTEEAINPWCSQDPRPFFRPPYGGYDAEVLAALGAAGYRRTVLWEIDTIDWRPIDNDPPGPTAGQIVTKVLANAQGGSIVLMHLGGYETYAALPAIVDGLGAAGFELVDLDEMLGG